MMHVAAPQPAPMSVVDPTSPHWTVARTQPLALPLTSSGSSGGDGMRGPLSIAADLPLVPIKRSSGGGSGGSSSLPPVNPRRPLPQPSTTLPAAMTNSASYTSSASYTTSSSTGSGAGTAPSIELSSHAATAALRHHRSTAPATSASAAAAPAAGSRRDSPPLRSEQRRRHSPPHSQGDNDSGGGGSGGSTGRRQHSSRRNRDSGPRNSSGSYAAAGAAGATDTPPTTGAGTRYLLSQSQTGAAGGGANTNHFVNRIQQQNHAQSTSTPSVGVSTIGLNGMTSVSYSLDRSPALRTSGGHTIGTFAAASAALNSNNQSLSARSRGLSQPPPQPAATTAPAGHSTHLSASSLPMSSLLSPNSTMRGVSSTGAIPPPLPNSALPIPGQPTPTGPTVPVSYGSVAGAAAFFAPDPHPNALPLSAQRPRQPVVGSLFSELSVHRSGLDGAGGGGGGSRKGAPGGGAGGDGFKPAPSSHESVPPLTRLSRFCASHTQITTILGVILCIGIGLTVFFVLRANDISSGQSRVQDYCTVLSGSLILSLNTAARTVSQFVSLVAAVPALHQSEFQVFYQFAAADFSASAVQSAAWAPYVPNENRTAWEARTGRNITRMVNGKFVRVDDNALPYYFPNELNFSPAFVGYDLMHQPGRSESVRECVESAAQTASPIYLFPSAKQDGFLLFVPLYHSNVSSQAVLPAFVPTSNDTRWRDVIGVVLGAIPVPGLFQRVASKEPTAYSNVVMSLLDTTPTGPSALYGATASADVGITDKGNQFHTDVTQRRSSHFTFAQRSYELQCDPIDGLVGTSQQTWVYAVLTLVLSSILLGALVTCTHQNRLQRGLEIANMRQRYAQRQNRQLDQALTQKQNLITVLIAKEKELETHSQQKSSFMSYLCHELRNPLHAILAALDMTNGDSAAGGAVSNPNGTPQLPSTEFMTPPVTGAVAPIGVSPQIMSATATESPQSIATAVTAAPAAAGAATADEKARPNLTYASRHGSGGRLLLAPAGTAAAAAAAAAAGGVVVSPLSAPSPSSTIVSTDVSSTGTRSTAPGTAPGTGTGAASQLHGGFDFPEHLSPDRRRAYAEANHIINESAKMMMLLLNDVLDMSKIKAGKMAFQTVPFDLRALIRDVARTFQPAGIKRNGGLSTARGGNYGGASHPNGLLLSNGGAAAGAGAAGAASGVVKLIADVDDIGIPRMVVGDPQRIRQILSNLVTNALKFTASGEVTVSAKSSLSTNASGSLSPSAADAAVLSSKYENCLTLSSSWNRSDQPVWLLTESPSPPASPAPAPNMKDPNAPAPAVAPTKSLPLPSDLGFNAPPIASTPVYQPLEMEVLNGGGFGSGGYSGGGANGTPGLLSAPPPTIASAPSNDVVIPIKADEKLAPPAPAASSAAASTASQQAANPAIDPHVITLAVEDSGLGMSGEELKHIFDPYVQAKQTVARDYGGTGLGLTIVRSLVQVMNGSITVCSTRGVGSCFIVRLRLPAANAVRLSASGAMPGSAGLTPPQLSDTAPLTTTQITPLQPVMVGGVPVTVGPALTNTVLTTAAVASLPTLTIPPTPSNPTNAPLLVSAAADCPPGGCVGAATALLGTDCPASAAAAAATAAAGTGMLVAVDPPTAVAAPASNSAPPATAPFVVQTPISAGGTLLTPANGFRVTPPSSNASPIASGSYPITNSTISAARDLTTSTGGSPKQNIPTGPALTILVVDDSALNRTILHRMMTGDGHRVFFASDGKQCVDGILSGTFPALDIILMDLMMPVMDGWEASRQLRINKVTVPIIALTANAMDSDRDKCANAGMNMFVPKPFSRLDLLRAIRLLTNPLPPAGTSGAAGTGFGSMSRSASNTALAALPGASAAAGVFTLSTATPLTPSKAINLQPSAQSAIALATVQPASAIASGAGVASAAVASTSGPTGPAYSPPHRSPIRRG